MCMCVSVYLLSGVWTAVLWRFFGDGRLGRRPWVGPRTRRRDYGSHLARENLGILQDSAGQGWTTTFLSLLLFFMDVIYCLQQISTPYPGHIKLNEANQIFGKTKCLFNADRCRTIDLQTYQSLKVTWWHFLSFTCIYRHKMIKSSSVTSPVRSGERWPANLDEVLMLTSVDLWGEKSNMDECVILAFIQN